MSDQLSLCAKELRKIDHDQFICGLFAPEESRDAFYALHLFYIETLRIRDLVGEAHLGLFRVQYWRDLIDTIYSKAPSNAENGTHKEMVTAMLDKSVDEKLFEQYFNARSFDMEDIAHDDMDALLRYCHATGGTAAKIKALAMNADSLEAVDLIGAALSLCEIVRTLPYQARKERCKIPTSLQRKHELDMKSFVDFQTSEALQKCVKELVLEIEKLIKEARTHKTDTNARAILLSTVSIEDYLKKLAKNSYDPFNPNIGGGRLSRQIKMGYRAWKGTF